MQSSARRGGGANPVEHRFHRQLETGAHGVEDPERLRLGETNHPLRQVAGVDELHRIVTVAGREDVAAPIETHRPVGEPIGLVTGTHDQSWPHDRRHAGEPEFGFLLRPRLERAVEIPHVLAERLLRLLHHGFVCARVLEER